ncbi:uncharacterized protein HKW66_Vig0143370 [Vigna angularis]|uniref:Pollen Ole e 1 allergen and extensin family protein n=2 Tax=Phaseolus angularis TaxID=3914 RepID=A0A8T0KC76_PHAAN|nr:uncharacterized protein LOC108339877 [Vigna angularis]KAG2397427.1 uncharacterized protein HKW66_Vig0143370 [Vigna angularis]BAT90395.1 hypothetical protein VIGAN_06163400 [Vigna angularis var. angularis]
MASLQLITVLLLVFALAIIQPSTSQTLQGKVSCVDCTLNYHLSDVKVSVKCDGVKKLVVATTENDGSFKANLPSDKRSCFAKVLGGAVQLYASGKDQISQIIKGKEYNSYTISTPLSFRTSCPPRTNCKSGKQVGSSKTVDLPLPPEWGLAPSSYYVPFFPIIGIP